MIFLFLDKLSPHLYFKPILKDIENVLILWLYVVRAAVVWHTAACPDGAAAGAGGTNISHHSKVCFLQEPAAHWMGHTTQKALWGKNTSLNPMKWLTSQFKNTGSVLYCLCVLYDCAQDVS